MPFDAGAIVNTPRLTRNFFDCPAWESLLATAKHQIVLTDKTPVGTDLLRRGTILSNVLEIVLSLYPECIGLWVPSAGRLLDSKQVLNYNLSLEVFDVRILHTTVNGRFMKYCDDDGKDTGDYIFDTLGMNLLGLPDVQVHYHGLDPNIVAPFVFDELAYIYTHNAPIRNYETVGRLTHRGYDPNGRWICRYEWSLLPPDRIVMDIMPEPGAYYPRERGTIEKGQHFPVLDYYGAMDSLGYNPPPLKKKQVRKLIVHGDSTLTMEQLISLIQKVYNGARINKNELRSHILNVSIKKQASSLVVIMTQSTSDAELFHDMVVSIEKAVSSY